MTKQIKFANRVSFEVWNIRETNSNLEFSLRDVDKNALEALLKDAQNTQIIKLIEKSNETQDETLIKAYAGYTGLSSMKTDYGVVTDINYEIQDKATDSGFAEEKHDVTFVRMLKRTRLELEVKAIKESQNIQDGAIEEIAGLLSDITDGQELQDGAIEDIAEVISEMAVEGEGGK